MKKYIAALAALCLCLCLACATAEEGANVEILKMDGVSVVVFTPITRLTRNPEGAEGSLSLPLYLTRIEDEAFMGVDAAVVEVSENVEAIGARAFANCPKLYKITIPASVTAIDDTALAGCEGVTVYGTAGTEAERFAQANGFAFVDPSQEEESTPSGYAPPITLPTLPFN